MIRQMFKLSLLSSLVAGSLAIPAVQAADSSQKPTTKQPEKPQTQQPMALSDKKSSSDNTLLVTAREQTLQAPGVSIIDSEAIKKHPIQRDVAEIIRTMPGVNLTGNSSSGQRGNNRQIDIRGMGPENTLILVDGMPVSSRNSVRYGWRGERDTRGDSNWVPPEMIDRIEVIRGPAAALYGNGAMGGVVNIITKPTTQAWHGNFNSYYNVPEHKQEGATKRYNASIGGALTDNLTMRIYGNWSKTQADGQNINDGHSAERTGKYAGMVPAGREGVINKNINSVLRWEFLPRQALELDAGYSRQGNLYAGDTQNTNSSTLVKENYGKETNIIYRQTLSLKYTGAWDNGVTTNNYIQFEKTRNTRLNEGLSGGLEGLFSSTDEGFSTIVLNDTNLHSDVNIPLDFGVNQTLTFGAEMNHQSMKDPASNTVTTTSDVPGAASSDRSKYSSADIYGFYTEDNMDLTDTTRLTPGLRFNYQTLSGSNWSPALNLSQDLGSDFTLKLGIARAWKAPNLYQTNPNYLLYSSGNGCYDTGSSCYLQGNKDLKAETSVNKEIGIEYNHAGVQAGLTWYRNDYRNKISAGTSSVYDNGTSNVYQWTNVPKAVIQGLEGTFNFPLSDSLTMNNNFTYIIDDENKSTGDYLTLIPKFTINSTLDWQATEALAVQGTMTWYGKQRANRYEASGAKTSGSETWAVQPYAVFGVSAVYSINKDVDLTAGIDNLLDERHFREGNSLTSGSSGTYAYGAGARTYNESGRTYYMELGLHF
ncbi:TonB-dependent siderophore receptor [Pantoea sp. Acro-835]|uniref:TonB-dependent siderophore receptor n=2 Tax=Candidatus Pantoea multigeneris TaxID=2608357 RepID=A0ABX0RME5_9GAMM|nr:TonB-dependent siderophore receptor [Pantoea multigeneris]NIF24569.1 TonB-dependent siderophore receptor [Pantoea multigeneris]